MAPWPIIVVAGLGIGLLLGLFGVGGSSVATPVLSLLGVPGLLAVASPLPATIPAALLAARAVGEARRQNRPLLVACAAGVGLFTGLLANGGGFLLVPLYLLVFGLRKRAAVGTSLIVIAALSIPTLATHWALGHIDWTVAFAFAAGLLPGSVAGSNLAHRVTGPSLRRAFGWFLIGFGAFFTIYRLVHS
jgi:Sulfite exporter TauE/SafE.